MKGELGWGKRQTEGGVDSRLTAPFCVQTTTQPLKVAATGAAALIGYSLPSASLPGTFSDRGCPPTLIHCSKVAIFRYCDVAQAFQPVVFTEDSLKAVPTFPGGVPGDIQGFNAHLFVRR
jgi:hypothetical protein